MSVCKVIAGSLTEWERRVEEEEGGVVECGKETSTVRGEMGRKGTEHKKSRKSRMTLWRWERDGGGGGGEEKGECLSGKPPPAGSSGWKLLPMASKERQAV